MSFLFVANVEDVDDDNRCEYGQEFLHHRWFVHPYHILCLHWRRAVWEGQVRRDAQQVSCAVYTVLYFAPILLKLRACGVKF